MRELYNLYFGIEGKGIFMNIVHHSYDNHQGNGEKQARKI